MTNKTYKIETNQDINDVVTEENWELLSADICQVLYDIAKIKKVAENPKDIKWAEFLWTDDGIVGHKITLVPKED